MCLYGAHLKHKESRVWGKKKDVTCESMHSGEKLIVNIKSKIFKNLYIGWGELKKKKQLITRLRRN